MRLSRIGHVCPVPRHVEACEHQQVGQAAGQAVQEAVHVAGSLARPLGDRVKEPERGVLKENVVAPGEVQHLEPEAHGQGLAHAQADGVEAAGARKRRALAEGAPSGLRHVARLLAAGVQGGERELADGILISRWLEVAGGARQENEGAVGVLQHIAEVRVLASVEEVLLEAPTVVDVQDTPDLLVERQHDHRRDQRRLHERDPRVVVVAPEEHARTGHRPKDAVLREGAREPEKQDRPRALEDHQEGRVANDRHEAERHDQQEPQHLHEEAHAALEDLVLLPWVRGLLGRRDLGGDVA
mmetsp:Transcript_12066/g.33056  ORF Transcript_12066/g.33056 Transcript_12066/m.33056 type:complete len:299 (-) Transcript_12066:776-1672(-)